MRFFSMGAWAAQSGVAYADRQTNGESGGGHLGGGERDGGHAGVWDEAGYRDHLAVVAPCLPAALVAAASERRQRVESLEWDPHRRRLELLVSTGSGAMSTSRYLGVRRYEWLDHHVRLPGDGTFGVIGCHELHLPTDANAAFEHRMLLSSGMELVVAAEEFELIA